MGRFSLKKAERLSKKKLIQELFEKGSSFYLYPFKILHTPHPESDAASHQILITVSARNFKRAVDRNRIKRRIREAYRTQKEVIQEKPSAGLFAFIYQAKELLPYTDIKRKVFSVLKKIEKLEF